MKALKWILLVLVFLFLIAGIGILFWLHYLLPDYNGKIKSDLLSSDVDVYYDEYAIPHIYAQNENDAWFALGYVHAQERLFQMEMLRRVGAGRLSEIFGADLINIDKLFRALDISGIAHRSAEKYFSGSDSAYQQLTLSYLKGINYYIDKGKTPVEFTLLDIPKSKFTVEDVYLISGYMGFSFTEALRSDPVTDYIATHWGLPYYNDLAHHYTSDLGARIPVSNQNDTIIHSAIVAMSKLLKEKLPVSIWSGSNSWVVAPSHSASGKVLFENDTHIGHASPSVWYEAHIECPGVSLYGNFLAGFPFPLIGHTKERAWGMTMLENDDFNFYKEKPNPANENQYWHKGEWKNYTQRQEIIKVKGRPDVVYTVKNSVHGPVIFDHQLHGLVKQMDSTLTVPVTAWWVYSQQEARTVQAAYRLCHSHNLNEMSEAAAMIDAPGINLMYGDNEGNIAWWATGRLYKLPEGTDERLLLDGSNERDDSITWLPFSENPKCVNPVTGFIYTANNQPDSVNGFLLPGYYAPNDRAERILQLLKRKPLLNIEDMRLMALDDTSILKVELKNVICNILEPVRKDSLETVVFNILKNWKGSHSLDDNGPVVFYNFLAVLFQNTMEDELGYERYHEFINGHTMKNSYLRLCLNDSSLWWDNVLTRDRRETRNEIIEQSFHSCVQLIKNKYGSNSSKWKWGNVHTLQCAHVLGRQKPLDKIFNAPKVAIAGGNETINSQGFALDTTGYFPVTYGPAMRVTLDFADIGNAKSVLPGGQSGYFYSPHYHDQLKLYAAGKYRPMLMNRKDVERLSKQHFIFKSQKVE